MQIFDNFGCETFFIAERSSTGLLEWDNKNDCVEALVNANHTPIPNPSTVYSLIILPNLLSCF